MRSSVRRARRDSDELRGALDPGHVDDGRVVRPLAHPLVEAVPEKVIQNMTTLCCIDARFPDLLAEVNEAVPVELHGRGVLGVGREVVAAGAALGTIPAR